MLGNGAGTLACVSRRLIQETILYLKNHKKKKKKAAQLDEWEFQHSGREERRPLIKFHARITHMQALVSTNRAGDAGPRLINRVSWTSKGPSLRWVGGRVRSRRRGGELSSGQHRQPFFFTAEMKLVIKT
jgi:hypothetical protein